MNKALLIAAAGTAILAAPASAAVVITGAANGPDMINPAAVDIDFSTVTPSYSGSGTGGIFTGSTGTHAAPLADTGAYFATVNGSLSLDLSGLVPADTTGFSFYWGSIDAYNTLTVTTSGGTYSFTGADAVDAPASPNGNQGSSLTNRRIFFDLGGETLTGLTFASTSPAFELDSIDFTTSAVPETASWAMMIGGFGLVGGALRLRRREAALA